jgi:hypothetical protein
VRRRVVIAGALAVLVAAAALAGILHSRRDPSPLPAAEGLASYRLAYRVEQPNQPTRTETRVVRRPFDSRSEQREGTAVVGGFITNERGLFQRTGDPAPGWRRIEPERHRPPEDDRVLSSLAEALRRGRATFLGTSVVLDRPCWRVRTRNPAGAVAVKPTAGDHAELCVDRTGLVLDERWVVDGQEVRHRAATELTVAPPLAAGDFEATPDAGPLPVSPSATAIRPLTRAQIDALPVSLAPPAGFVELGSVVRERSVPGRPILLTAVVRYVRDGLLVEVELSDRVGDERVPGDDVSVPGVGTGRLELSVGNSELVLTLGRQLVRVRSADLDVLRATAKGLASKPGR